MDPGGRHGIDLRKPRVQGLRAFCLYFRLQRLPELGIAGRLRVETIAECPQIERRATHEEHPFSAATA